MLKYLSTTLLTGVITLFPLVLTIYLLYWLGVTSEEIMRKIFRYVLPDDTYFPGLGMFAGIIIVFIVGLMMKAYLVRKIFSLGENLLYRLPLIKSVYRAFRDFFDFFSPKKEGLGQAVAVTFQNIELIGFVTQEIIINNEYAMREYKSSQKRIIRQMRNASVGGVLWYDYQDRPAVMSAHRISRDHYTQFLWLFKRRMIF